MDLKSGKGYLYHLLGRKLKKETLRKRFILFKREIF